MMDNVQNYDSYISILSSHTSRSLSEELRFIPKQRNTKLHCSQVKTVIPAFICIIHSSVYSRIMCWNVLESLAV
jgi:hypothetical protein